MTTTPVAVGSNASMADVTRVMRDEDIGAVMVTENDQLRGLMTVRELVVRGREHRGPRGRRRVQLVSFSPEDDIRRAVELMHGFPCAVCR